ncbi:hypothetical protein GCM10022199_27610 [Marihabitans asiaticum]
MGKRGLLFWSCLVGLLALLIAAAAAVLAYWLAAGGWIGEPKGRVPRAVTDAIRIGLTTAAGAGAAVALVVAFRRQRLLEEDREGDRQSQMALHERYQEATAQLGHDNLTIRLAGVYALAAVADDWIGRGNRGQAQVCVDVLCSYLRTDARAKDGSQPDLEVRQTITRVIASHLQPGASFSWGGFFLDFTGARFTGRHSFVRAEFTGGEVSFNGAEFTGGEVSFNLAKFTGGRVSFDQAEFTSRLVSFVQAEFSGGLVSFEKVKFTGGGVSFFGAEFTGGEVSFFGAEFTGGEVSFDGAKFASRRLSFDGAKFTGSEVSFDQAEFTGSEVSFDGAKFASRRVSFDGAEFTGGEVSFLVAEFSGGLVSFDGAEFTGGEVSFLVADFTGGRVSFEEARLPGGSLCSHSRVVFGPWPRPPAPLPVVWPPAGEGQGPC